MNKNRTGSLGYREFSKLVTSASLMTKCLSACREQKEDSKRRSIIDSVRETYDCGRIPFADLH